jgi:hypothetical protein
MQASIQEQEDRDFEAGAASEAENCYAEAKQLAVRNNHFHRAYSLAKAGHHVVCVPVDIYCRATDAFVQVNTRIVAVCQSRTRAEALAATRPGSGQEGDYGYFVFEVERPVGSTPVVVDDSCPF